jgi:hypothetical protein
VLLLVEGLYDVEFLSRISAMLARDDPAIPDLGTLIEANLLICVPCGGSPLPWSHRFRALGCSEVHVFDRESGAETALRQAAADQVNSRPGCRAFLTRHRSLENYLRPPAIQAAGGPLLAFGGDDCVSTFLAAAWHALDRSREPWSTLEKPVRLKKTQRAKRWLNTRAVQHMTRELLAESDPHGDITGWLVAISEMIGEPRTDPAPRASWRAAVRLPAECG